jgi:hypothetical protein
MYSWCPDLHSLWSPPSLFVRTQTTLQNPRIFHPSIRPSVHSHFSILILHTRIWEERKYLPTNPTPNVLLPLLLLVGWLVNKRREGRFVVDGSVVVVVHPFKSPAEFRILLLLNEWKSCELEVFGGEDCCWLLMLWGGGGGNTVVAMCAEVPQML